jgi:hypothetical protein
LFCPVEQNQYVKNPRSSKKAVKLCADHQSEDKINSTSSVVAVQVDIDVDDTLTMRRQSPAPGYYGTKKGREVFKRFWILDHVSLFPPCHSVPPLTFFPVFHIPKSYAFSGNEKVAPSFPAFTELCCLRTRCQVFFGEKMPFFENRGKTFLKIVGTHPRDYMEI